MTDTFLTLWQTLASGLPLLLLHFGTAVAILIAGAMTYRLVTPFRERTLIAQGNRSAGLVLSGAIISLAIPLAATLATSQVWLDILLWGMVAVLIQLLAFMVFTLFFRGLRTAIDQDNVAVALVLVGVQLAIGLLNAGTMVG
jgi:putative membrane protein